MNGTNSNSDVDNNVLPNEERGEIDVGCIILCPRNCICKVNWVKEDRIGVSYLELPNAHNSFKLDEVKLLARVSRKPYFDEITSEKLKQQKEIEKENAKKVEEFKRSKSKSKTNKVKTKEEKALTKMLEKLTPEELLKLLEE